MRRPAARLLAAFSLLLLLTAVFAIAGAPARAEEEGPDLSTADGVKEALADKDPAVRLAAAREAVMMQDAELTKPLVRLLKDDEAPVREMAVAALTAREAEREKKAAAKAIAALLTPLGREPDEADIAREKLLVPALHDLAQPEGLKRLLEIHPLAPAELVKARLHAVGNIPTKEAIEALIAFGSRGRRNGGQRAHAAEALQYATGMKLGNDPDKWRAWWREVEATWDPAKAAEARREREAQREAKERQRKERGERRKRREKDGEGQDGEGDEEEGESAAPTAA